MTDIGSVLSSLVRRESFSNEGVEGALQGTVIGGGEIGGPTRTRTWDQWIHIVTIFQPCADYLISLADRLRCVRERDALACY